MTRTEYQQYIRSEAWLQRRRTFLFVITTCNRCPISRELAKKAYDQDLHVHHRNYEHVGCEPDEDLEALCRRCHEIESFGKTDLTPAHMTSVDLLYLRSLISGPRPEPRNTYMTEDGLAGVFA